MNYYFLAFILLLASCQDNLESRYQEALSYKEKKEYRDSNIILNDIINSPESSQDLKTKSHFLLAQIFYDLRNYEASILSYKNILNEPLESPIRKKALFMIAYTYFNDLDMYSHSARFYNMFIEQYPNDELVDAVNFELEQINDIVNNKLKEE